MRLEVDACTHNTGITPRNCEGLRAGPEYTTTSQAPAPDWTERVYTQQKNEHHCLKYINLC